MGNSSSSSNNAVAGESGGRSNIPSAQRAASASGSTSATSSGSSDAVSEGAAAAAPAEGSEATAISSRGGDVTACIEPSTAAAVAAATNPAEAIAGEGATALSSSSALSGAALAEEVSGTLPGRCFACERHGIAIVQSDQELRCSHCGVSGFFEHIPGDTAAAGEEGGGRGGGSERDTVAAAAAAEARAAAHQPLEHVLQQVSATLGDVAAVQQQVDESRRRRRRRGLQPQVRFVSEEEVLDDEEASVGRILNAFTNVLGGGISGHAAAGNSVRRRAAASGGGGRDRGDDGHGLGIPPADLFADVGTLVTQVATAIANELQHTPATFDVTARFEAAGGALDQIIASIMQAEGNPRYGSPPAAASVIASLKDERLTEDEARAAGPCAICQEDYKPDDFVHRLNVDAEAAAECSHIFHRHCIVPWLQEHNSCPVCRYELPTDDAEYNERRARLRERVRNTLSSAVAAAASSRTTPTNSSSNNNTGRSGSSSSGNSSSISSNNLSTSSSNNPITSSSNITASSGSSGNSNSTSSSSSSSRGRTSGASFSFFGATPSSSSPSASAFPGGFLQGSGRQQPQQREEGATAAAGRAGAYYPGATASVSFPGSAAAATGYTPSSTRFFRTRSSIESHLPAAASAEPRQTAYSFTFRSAAPHASSPAGESAASEGGSCSSSGGSRPSHSNSAAECGSSNSSASSSRNGGDGGTRSSWWRRSSSSCSAEDRNGAGFGFLMRTAFGGVGDAQQEPQRGEGEVTSGSASATGVGGREIRGGVASIGSASTDAAASSAISQSAQQQHQSSNSIRRNGRLPSENSNNLANETPTRRSDSSSSNSYDSSNPHGSTFYNGGYSFQFGTGAIPGVGGFFTADPTVFAFPPHVQVHVDANSLSGGHDFAGPATAAMQHMLQHVQQQMAGGFVSEGATTFGAASSASHPLMTTSNYTSSSSSGSTQNSSNSQNSSSLGSSNSHQNTSSNRALREGRSRSFYAPNSSQEQQQHGRIDEDGCRQQ